MGNGVTRLNACCAAPAGDISRRHDVASMQDGLGHSFYYVRPDPTTSPDPLTRPSPPSKFRRADNEEAAANNTTFFRLISGASVGANPSTALSTSAPTEPYSSPAFESSDCFASGPLQPLPRGGTAAFLASPKEQKEKEKGNSGKSPRRFLGGSKTDSDAKLKKKRNSLVCIFLNLISSTKSSCGKKNVVVEPISSSDTVNESEDSDRIHDENVNERNDEITSSNDHVNDKSGDEEEGEKSGEFSMQRQNVQWAQGKAGEDRVHIVVSEEHGWLFVGIYDGFNGPDAPDYLLHNLYAAVHKELKGLLWNDRFEPGEDSSESSDDDSNSSGEINETQMARQGTEDCCDLGLNRENCVMESGRNPVKRVRRKGKMWRIEWDRDEVELIDRGLDNGDGQSESNGINHGDVLKALSQALKKTEEAYLERSDMMVRENPELSLMGSCVLVMLMKGEDMYLMNVGDSRAVLAQKIEPNMIGLGRRKQGLERIKEDESLLDIEETGDSNLIGGLTNLIPLQLTKEHSTRVEEEVKRIVREHPDDASAIDNERVKGYLKVTRAFGAGFLKQPKWNDAILEMFRINYIGTSPYITCAPSLRHHRLTSRDKFLILSSDGLYEYFSNEEAVFEVDSFIAAFPEGDPAKHLIEEVLIRAAKKFGMDFHELLEIPQGDRRRYHDDVSVIVLSLEGRIWRSSM